MMKFVFLIICLKIVKSQYFIYDDDYPVNNDTLSELDQSKQENLIENYNQPNNFFPPEASSAEKETISPQINQTSEKLITQINQEPKRETTSEDKNDKIVQKFFDQFSTPVISEKEQDSNDYYKEDYTEFDYDEFMSNNYDFIEETVDSTTKETILEKAIDVKPVAEDQSPKVKGGFNLLYIFVPVVTIAALVVVVALAVIFRKIAIKKQNSTTNKNVIYRQVATSDIPKV